MSTQTETSQALYLFNQIYYEAREYIIETLTEKGYNPYFDTAESRNDLMIEAISSASRNAVINIEWGATSYSNLTQFLNDYVSPSRLKDQKAGVGFLEAGNLDLIPKLVEYQGAYLLDYEVRWLINDVYYLFSQKLWDDVTQHIPALPAQNC